MPSAATLRQEPAYGLRPLSDSQLTQCGNALRPHWLGTVERPAMLSYATQVSSHWQLGLSAARHGMPLVLAGLGQPRWPWYQGGRKKLPGSRRALQISHQLWPQQPVISSDTGDLLIGNSLGRTHLATLAGLSDSARMFIAAECNSWPVCYRDAYAHDAEHHRCLAKHSACYPNSGVLTASARTMLHFYDEWARVIIGSNDLGKAERWNDQAAVHRLFQNRSQYAAFRLKVDAANLFSLQLWKCEGALAKASGKHFHYCHERSFDPTAGLNTAADGTSVTYTDERGVEQKPFLVHSNGHHYVLSKEESHLRPLLELYAAVPPAELHRLLRHPVVLVDTAEHGPCNVTTLGWLMNATHSPEGAPWLRL